MDAARSPGWSIGLGRSGQIMATKDSGTIGMPWVISAVRLGNRMRVSLYRPGDDTEAEGDVKGDLIGNPREMGRQLRSLLEDTALEIEES
jgi:hypothetical protein